MNKKNLPFDVKIDNNKNNVLKRRLKLLQYKELYGGKCSICGYEKNYSALEFHHKESPLFRINTQNIQKKKEKIEKEIKKCILLCANCHQELHNPQLEKSIYKEMIETNFLSIFQARKILLAQNINWNTIEELEEINKKTMYKMVKFATKRIINHLKQYNI